LLNTHGAVRRPAGAIPAPGWKLTWIQAEWIPLSLGEARRSLGKGTWVRVVH